MSLRDHVEGFTDLIDDLHSTTDRLADVVNYEISDIFEDFFSTYESFETECNDTSDTLDEMIETCSAQEEQISDMSDEIEQMTHEMSLYEIRISELELQIHKFELKEKGL